MANSKIPSWDHWFLDMSYLVSQKSKDRSTQVGCVLVGDDNEVLSVGYNNFPRGVNDDIDERHERPVKYSYVEHAERNAIFNAARQGIRLKGARAYMYWKSPPCEQCTRALIQAGIKEIIVGTEPFPGVGNGDFYNTSGPAETMLREAGVPLRVVEDYVPTKDR